MTPEKLKQTDESLVNLIRDRLRIVAQSGVPNLGPHISSLFAKLSVPKSVWASNALTTYIAGLSAKASGINNNEVKPKTVTVIGGRGRMGAFFCQQLSATGHKVSVLGHHDWAIADKLLGEAELVLVSVPIEHTVDVIKRAARYLAPTTALADITSIKVQPVQTMLEHHTGPVMGLHPMFGPSVKSFSEQKVVVCSGRNDDAFQWLVDLMASKGAQIINCTPEEHDRMMVIIQATRHFSRLCFGIFLAEERIDIDRSLLMSSPTYRQEIEIANRLFAQNPALCADIILATEDRIQAIEKLASTYNRLAELVANKDRTALIQEFEKTQSFFTQERLRSSNEREHAIAASSN